MPYVAQEELFYRYSVPKPFDVIFEQPQWSLGGGSANQSMHVGFPGCLAEPGG
ncbi:hypothetical protein [Geobacter sp. FeAm09]|uniref:hypothetical protein n=1 Tax=Geobacter sp. FeAm09 TaxID=2597769 RepID=UPI00143DCE28|nr:hypothetical protein [Geobacter sp. FeAm09]